MRFAKRRQGKYCERVRVRQESSKPPRTCNDPACTNRCRANPARIRQSRPCYGLEFSLFLYANVLTTFQVVPSSLDSGTPRAHTPAAVILARGHAPYVTPLTTCWTRGEGNNVHPTEAPPDRGRSHTGLRTWSLSRSLSTGRASLSH